MHDVNETETAVFDAVIHLLTFLAEGLCPKRGDPFPLTFSAPGCSLSWKAVTTHKG